MIKIIKPFIVWVFHDIILELSGFDYLFSSITCLVIIVIISYDNLKHGFMIDWISLSYFSSSILLALFIADHWFLKNPIVVVSALYTLASGMSLLLNRPYTLQYAKEETSPEMWSDPHFNIINVHLTGVWTVVFLICFLMSLLSIMYEYYWPFFIIARSTAILMGIIVSEQYPDYYLKKLS
ncbi:hypothetical protein V6259_19280 [Marinomonas sp. TI.3.20]|uniref:hypothetical protein n=1 Tax=Marinomonas sp. TI.3.20 TaxID=3121296 RepID=UPI00311E608F